MRKIMIFAASAALVFAGCASAPKDPVKDAIKAEILRMEQGFTSVRFDSVEKIDSVTYGQELERRVKTFELKRDADQQFLVKYSSQHKPKNAAIKQFSYIEDLRILKALDSLGTVIAPISGNVAYYNYKFSAQAKGESSTMKFVDAYVAITPSNEVIGMASKLGDVNKGLGKVVPGYMDIVRSEEQSEAEVPE